MDRQYIRRYIQWTDILPVINQHHDDLGKVQQLQQQQEDKEETPFIIKVNINKLNNLL